MSEIQHEDKCRWWDDEESCDCGALAVDKLEKENAALRARIAELTQGWEADRVELERVTTHLEAYRADALEEAARVAHDRLVMMGYGNRAIDVQDAIRALQTTPPSTEPPMLICSCAGHEKCFKFCGHLKPHERKEDYCNESRCRHIGEFVHCIPCAKTS